MILVNIDDNDKLNIICFGEPLSPVTQQVTVLLSEANVKHDSELYIFGGRVLKLEAVIRYLMSSLRPVPGVFDPSYEHMGPGVH